MEVVDVEEFRSAAAAAVLNLRCRCCCSARLQTQISPTDMLQVSTAKDDRRLQEESM